MRRRFRLQIRLYIISNAQNLVILMYTVHSVQTCTMYINTSN